MAQLKLIEKVKALYDLINIQLKASHDKAGLCKACGKCCNFTEYDHRLYITPPELEYLKANIGVKNIKPMRNGICPYIENGKCRVYNYRFAGCRIFCCDGNSDFQNELTEMILEELKKLCQEFDLEYKYMQLSEALKIVTIKNRR